MTNEIKEINVRDWCEILAVSRVKWVQKHARSQEFMTGGVHIL